MKGNRFWRESRSQNQGSDRNPDFLDLLNSPNKRLLRRYPHQGNIKQEDEEGYPLSDFEDPSGSIKEPIIPDKCSMVRIKRNQNSLTQTRVMTVKMILTHQKMLS